MQVVASEDEDEEIDMAGTELLDNLTFINSKGVMGGVEGKPDWVTGIQGEKWAVQKLRAGETEEQQDRAWIEFYGDNVAEIIEGEEEIKAREKRTRSQAWSQHGTGTNHKTYIFYHDSSDCSQYRTIFQ